VGTIYDEIYEKAKPYLDTRQNEIHVSMSYEFARRLVSHYQEADASIVFPAILLHDVGWKMLPEEKQVNAFGPRAADKEARRLHEIEGARIAEQILKSLNYDEDKTLEILTIIDGHDSRLEALSLNDALVKDADKLWRYTRTGVNIDHVRFHMDRDSLLDLRALSIAKVLFTPESRGMARAALAEARTTSGAK
jgi:hypothetical protein